MDANLRLKNKYEREGRDAGHWGRPRECPYKKTSIVAVWLAAYDDAAKKRAERNAAAKAKKLAEIDDEIQRAEKRLADLRQRREALAAMEYHATMWDRV